MNNTDSHLYEIANVAAAEWYRLAIAAPVRLSLWWREAQPGEAFGAIKVASEAPGPEYRRSIPLSSAWSREQAKGRIYDALRSLPILGSPEARSRVA